MQYLFEMSCALSLDAEIRKLEKQAFTAIEELA